MIVRLSQLLFLAIFFFGVGGAHAQLSGSNKPVDELMVKSGMWTQLGQVEAGVLAGIDQAQAQARARGTPLAEAGFARLRQANARAFAPGRLRTDMRAQLVKLLSTAEQSQVLVFLRTDHGARMTALEERSGEIEEYKKAEEAAPEYFKSLPAERVNRIKRIVKAMRADEAMAGIIINNNIAILNGLALTAPAQPPVDVQAMRRQVEAQRPKLLEVLGKKITERYAYIYQPLSDADLDKFLEFADSALGMKYHAAIVSGLEKVLADAALGLGFDLGGQKLGPERKPGA